MISSTVTLLIVDDDDVDRETITRSLRRQSISSPIITAGDGVAALERLRGTHDQSAIERPIIVILDWKMPRMNGLEFLEELRADPDLRETIVFVLTTSDDERDIFDAYQNLIAGYIVKKSAGSDFAHLIDMLGAYGRVVELPT